VTMPYDESIKRGDPPVYPGDPGPSPLIPEDVRQEILKSAWEKSKALRMLTRKPKSKPSKSSRKR
jgi:hypothetical protein